MLERQTSSFRIFRFKGKGKIRLPAAVHFKMFIAPEPYYH
jgi:hypothetical protein